MGGSFLLVSGERASTALRRILIYIMLLTAVPTTNAMPFLILGHVFGAVIQRVEGPARSEATHLSAAGGAELYITGSDLGSPFDPPRIFVGSSGEGECVVQGFTSLPNRLHCIIRSTGLHPTTSYLSALDSSPGEGAKWLGVCQGDCNSDDDCSEDLVCFQRDAD